MADVILSLLPVFALILLGALLRRFALLTPEGWMALERITYFVLFPPVLFMSIIGGSFAGEETARMALALGLANLAMSALMILIRPLLPATGAQFSSIFQAGLRWNSYVALGVITSLMGKPGVALAAVAFAVMVPLNNLFSVLVITRYASHAPAPIGKIARSIAANPLIIATLSGIFFAIFAIPLPKPAEDILNLLGQGTVAVGLLCVGAALDFGSMGSAKAGLAAGVILRVAVMPALTFGLCLLMGVSHQALLVGLITVSAPVATSAYILARQLGGDATLMANLTTLTTLASLVSMPAAILIAGAIN